MSTVTKIGSTTEVHLVCDGCRQPLPDDRHGTLLLVGLRAGNAHFCRLGCLHKWARRFDVED